MTEWVMLACDVYGRHFAGRTGHIEEYVTAFGQWIRWISKVENRSARVHGFRIRAVFLFGAIANSE